MTIMWSSHTFPHLFTALPAKSRLHASYLAHFNSLMLPICCVHFLTSSPWAVNLSLQHRHRVGLFPLFCLVAAPFWHHLGCSQANRQHLTSYTTSSSNKCFNFISFSTGWHKPWPLHVETCNPACADLLMNSDHKPKTRSVWRTTYILEVCKSLIWVRTGQLPLRKN